jgi:hypothetical protein
MQDNDPKDDDPFEVMAKAAANRKLPEPDRKARRPTKALRPKPQPPIQMPNLFEGLEES